MTRLWISWEGIQYLFIWEDECDMVLLAEVVGK